MDQDNNVLLGFLTFVWKTLIFSIPVVEFTVDEKEGVKHRMLRLSNVSVYTGTKEDGGQSVMYRSNLALAFAAYLCELALSEKHKSTTYQFVDKDRNPIEDLMDLGAQKEWLYHQSLDAKVSRMQGSRQRETKQQGAPKGGNIPF